MQGLGTPHTPAEEAAVGEKAGNILLAMYQDFYRQEVGAEEDVHRTLPFFATALGLIIAALNYAAGQLPAWHEVQGNCRDAAGQTYWLSVLGCAWPAVLVALLLVGAAVLAVGVLVLLALATRRRDYRRVGPEPAQLERARALAAYHRGRGLVGDELDAAVAVDLRDQLLADFAEVIPLNRDQNLRRYKRRALAVSYLLWSLFCALAGTILILATTKFGLLGRALP
ncbi:hypothetical protein [Sphingomonas sp.]|uniref:hypothetical protein n=1 Tax=Sphingomonas sp. TaxID=28214 RepID=UPI0025FCCC15|nr:hypothetical protein [Sphingomonas sp.]